MKQLSIFFFLIFSSILVKAQDSIYSQKCFVYKEQKIVIHFFKPKNERETFSPLDKIQAYRNIGYLETSYYHNIQQKEFYLKYFSLSPLERLQVFTLGLKNNSFNDRNKYANKLTVPKYNELGYVPLLCIYDFEGLTEIKEDCIDGGLAGYYVYDYEKLSNDSTSWANYISSGTHRAAAPLDSIDLPSKYTDYTILMTYFKKNMNDRVQYAIMISDLQLFKDDFFYEVIFNDIKALLKIKHEDKSQIWAVIHHYNSEIKHLNSVDKNKCEVLTKDIAKKFLIKYR